MTTTNPTSTRQRPRAVRVGYLVSGLVSLGVAGVWALWAAGVADGLSVSWLLPAVLLVAGLAGLATLAAGGRRTPQPEPSPTEPTHPDDQTRPYPTKES